MGTEWNRNHPEKIRESYKIWANKNPEKVKEATKKWRTENPDKVREWKQRHYKRYKIDIFYKNMFKKFGLTREQYDFLWDKQNGCCPICEKHLEKYTKDSATDHNHNTGIVRGITCSLHNRAMGMFGDDPNLLRKAANYLEDKLNV